MSIVARAHGRAVAHGRTDARAHVRTRSRMHGRMGTEAHGSTGALLGTPASALERGYLEKHGERVYDQNTLYVMYTKIYLKRFS